MADQQAGRTSADFRSEHAVNGLKRNPNGSPQTVDPYDQILADQRKASAVKLMAQQDKSLDVDILKADNERLKAEIEQQQLLEAKGGPQVAGNPWQDYLMRNLESLQGQLREAQRDANAAQQSILDDRLRMMQDELARVKTTTPEERDELELTMTTLDKALAIADRVRPPAREVVDRGPDPGLRRFELTLEADREQRKYEAEERRQQLQMDLQLKRESLAREEARLDKQSASQERFLTDTVPKLLQLGQQLVETLAVKLGPSGAPAATGLVRGETTEPTPIRPVQPVIPPGAKGMECHVCHALIIYRDGWPEVICSSCGASYSNSETPAAGAVAERGPANAEEDAQTWLDDQRKERYEPAAERQFDSDPAIPA